MVVHGAFMVFGGIFMTNEVVLGVLNVLVSGMFCRYGFVGWYWGFD